MATNYPKDYSYDTIVGLESFKVTVEQYCNSLNSPAVVLESPIQNCLFCTEKIKNWFIIKAPPLFKDPILYKTSNIGNINLRYLFLFILLSINI
jgi:hypothetical protein